MIRNLIVTLAETVPDGSFPSSFARILDITWAGGERRQQGSCCCISLWHSEFGSPPSPCHLLVVVKGEIYITSKQRHRGLDTGRVIVTLNFQEVHRGPLTFGGWHCLWRITGEGPSVARAGIAYVTLRMQPSRCCSSPESAGENCRNSKTEMRKTLSPGDFNVTLDFRRLSTSTSAASAGHQGQWWGTVDIAISSFGRWKYACHTGCTGRFFLAASGPLFWSLSCPVESERHTEIRIPTKVSATL